MLDKKQQLELKSISDILEYKYFYIPSYQRGYKWDSRQVKDLLQDILEFSQNKKNDNEFYCLQPIVIVPEKYDNDKVRYRVIDGQQRLTTIYIILKYMQEFVKKYQSLKEKIENNENLKDILNFCMDEELEIKPSFEITYQTRETKNNEFFEKKLSNGLNYENSDFYHMSNAFLTISEWFKGENKSIFLTTLLEYTKVIWYEVDIDSKKDKEERIKEEIKIFTRLNIGKIPLTNAELIKAMLLLPIGDYKKQIEFSSKWDSLELTLQNDEFWYFLTSDKKSDTAIDLILTLLAQNYKNNKDFNIDIEEGDNKFSFYVFDKVLKDKHKSANDIWDESQEFFRYLVDWFNDREIYHKVGYLLNFNYTLLDLINDYKGKTKSEFKDSLHIKIENMVSNVILMNIEYKHNKNDKIIEKVLLLFNIETILRNKNSNIKFQFDRYKYKDKDNKENWDIEHISSQTQKGIETKQERIDWLETLFKYYFIIEKTKETKETNEKYEKHLKKLSSDKWFEKFYIKISKKLQQNNTIETDNIANLTLLDSKTNRGYGNAFFPIKRAIIIEKDSKGTFVPIATKNLFLKQYSKKLSNMMNWDGSDMESYRKAIYNTLKHYGVKYDKTGE